MKEEPLVVNIEIKDALYKTELYLNKIMNTMGSTGQIQKICHLAAETCTKYGERQEFCDPLYISIFTIIKSTRSYFLFYLLNILIKNSRYMCKIAKKDLQELFKMVWDATWSQPKNQVKLECLRAMVKSWNIIYSDRVQETIQFWLQQKYKQTLNLEAKNEQIYKQLLQRHKVPIKPKPEPQVIRAPEIAEKKSSLKIDLQLFL